MVRDVLLAAFGISLVLVAGCQGGPAGSFGTPSTTESNVETTEDGRTTTDISTPSRCASVRRSPTEVDVQTRGSTVDDAERKDRDELERIAREHLSETHDIAIADLEIGNGATVEYDVLDESYYNLKVLDERSNRAYSVALNWRGHVVNLSKVEERAERTYHRKYGNLDRQLYRLVQNTSEDAHLQVLIWLDYDGSVSGLTKNQTRIREFNARVGTKIEQIDGVKSIDWGDDAPRMGAVATPGAICEMQAISEMSIVSYFNTTGADGGGD